jgi:hypothetical protein
VPSDSGIVLRVVRRGPSSGSSDRRSASNHTRAAFPVEFIHPHPLVRDLIDLNHKRATGVFRELRARNCHALRKIDDPIEQTQRNCRRRSGWKAGTSAACCGIVDQ